MGDQHSIAQIYKKNELINFFIEKYTILEYSHLMPNHKSAVKRSIQSIKKNKVNQIISQKIRKSFSRLNRVIDQKDQAEMVNLFQKYNSALSKGVKRGIINQRHASRKLSSLSNKIKK